MSHQYPSNEQEVSNHQSSPLPLRKREALWIGLALLVGSLLGVLLGLLTVQGIRYSSERARQAKIVKNAREVKDSFVTDEEENNFKIKLADITSLAFTTKEQAGVTADEVVERFGLASSAQFKEERLSLEWEKNGNRIELEFTKIDNVFRLKSADLGNFDENFSGSKYAEWEDDVIPADFVAKLETGDAETGKGGTSYKEVLKKYKRPWWFEIKGENSEGDESENIEMRLSYKTKDGESIYLQFIRQANGDFLLSDSH